MEQNNDILIQEITEYRQVLQSIINGAVHPEIALCRVMVNLGPIRAVLKKYPERENSEKTSWFSEKVW